MAFESLTDKLQNVFKNLRSKGRLTEADVREAMKEVRMALLEADVNFKVDDASRAMKRVLCVRNDGLYAVDGIMVIVR